MYKTLDTQNVTSFFISGAEICIYPKKEDRPLSVIKPTQKHTNIIMEIVIGTENLDGCDGLYTRRRDITLAIGTSDCAPICFVSPDQIGIVHAGWRGLVSGIIENMKEKFDMSKTTIYVAPFLHRFEIQKDFCFDVIQACFSDKYFTYEDGLIFFEFKQAIQSLFTHAIVFWDSRDTGSDLSLPSYRRTKILNNFLTTISLK